MEGILEDILLTAVLKQSSSKLLWNVPYQGLKLIENAWNSM